MRWISLVIIHLKLSTFIILYFLNLCVFKCIYIYFASTALLGYCLLFSCAKNTIGLTRFYLIVCILCFSLFLSLIYLIQFWFCHLFILPYFYHLFLSDHCWRRSYTAFGCFRAIVDFACYVYYAAVLLATLIDRYTRSGKRDFFF